MAPPHRTTAAAGDQQLREETFSAHPKSTQVIQPEESHLSVTFPTFDEEERKRHGRAAGWGRRSGGGADAQNAEGCRTNALRTYESVLN